MLTKYAFFDADETVLNMKSMFDFLEFYLVDKFGAQGKSKFKQIKNRFTNSSHSREYLNNKYYENFTGISHNEIKYYTRKWYQERWCNNPNKYITKSIELINKLKYSNVKLFFVSGSFKELLKPFERELGFCGSLSSVPQVINGHLTGRLMGHPCIGKAKMARINKLTTLANIPLERCIAVGDNFSDRFMLSGVGERYVVNPDKELYEYALSNGWKFL